MKSEPCLAEQRWPKRIREMKPRIAQILRRVEHRILGQPRIRRDRQVARIASDHDFEFSGSGASTQSVMQERGRHSDSQAGECYRDNNDHNRSRESSRIRENSRMHVCGALVVVL